MSTRLITTLFLLLAVVSSCKDEEKNMLEMVHEAVVHATKWSKLLVSLSDENEMGNNNGVGNGYSALSDCVEEYEDSEDRLWRLLTTSPQTYRFSDKLSWLNGVLTSHSTCLDELHERGYFVPQEANNLTTLLHKALDLFARLRTEHREDKLPLIMDSGEKRGLLVSWNASISKADYVVAKDGTGNYTTINEVVEALDKRKLNEHERVVVYVKSGNYSENVKINKDMKNVMFVGDGIDKTIVSSNWHATPHQISTRNSATFLVVGDGFWARDMTFENTAGPQNGQAVAITVQSDHSVFYRCSFKGYQDTLYVYRQTQFYRDCHVYGTVDFIFGNSEVVLQNCDIYVRRPRQGQCNVITAQGRKNSSHSTGISMHMSRISPAPDLEPVKGSFQTFLGRPWKEYSRTVFFKTDLGSLIHPKGWTEWNKSSFALLTLYYGEYNNSGSSAFTGQRVDWPGYHVLKDPHEAEQFTVSNFIDGEYWLPMSGVPFSPGL